MVYNPLDRQPPPPDCGRRLLPAVIDQLARDDPDRPWGSLPYDDWDLSQGYEDISYSRLANAIDKLAWFIVDTIGRSTAFDTVLYLGVPDIRYHMMQMAVCKTGHKVLFSSHLNSLPIHLHLMNETQCTTVLSATGVHVDDILGARGSFSHAIIPELDDLLNFNEKAKPFPYTKTFDQAKDDPFVILHSSGTTGTPKVVVVNHASLARTDAQKLLPYPSHGRGSGLDYTWPVPGTRELLPTPVYHVMACFMSQVRSVFGGGVYVPGFRHKSVHTSDVRNILDHANVSVAALTPWIMEDIARQPDAVKYIKSLEHVTFGGAILSPFASNLWSKHTSIQNTWGSTEFFTCPQLKARADEAEYIVFNVDVGGIEFRDTGAITLDKDGKPLRLHEMILTVDEKTEHIAAWAAIHGVSINNAVEKREISVGDLWTPHPDPERAAYVWQFAGRVDDMITFASAINFHPAPIERSLGESPLVNASQVVGAGRLQPLVLVELVDDLGDVEAVKEKLWEDVFETLNSKLPAQGTVSRTHIKLYPNGSFVKTAKGSIKKKENEAKFAEDIDKIYEEFGDIWEGGRERYASISKKVDFKVTVELPV